MICSKFLRGSPWVLWNGDTALRTLDGPTYFSRYLHIIFQDRTDLLISKRVFTCAVVMKVASLWLWIFHIALATPLPQSRSTDIEADILNERSPDQNIYPREPSKDRTIIIMIAMFCMMLLSTLLGSRFGRLRNSAFIKRKCSSMLILTLYFIVMSFIVCATVMLAGQNIHVQRLCYMATWICLGFYFTCKLVIYVFFVERIHVVRAPFVRRSRDWLYIGCMIVVIASFLGVCVNAFRVPIMEVQENGTCHMGLPVKASIPFLIIATAVDIVQTGVFCYLLRPIVKTYGVRTITSAFRSRVTNEESENDREEKETTVQKSIRILLWKSLVASILIILATVANVTQFYVAKGRVRATICLSTCLIDVCWDTVVIHWLTFGSAEAEKHLDRSTAASTMTELTSRSLSMTTSQDHEAGDAISIEEPQKVLSGRPFDNKRHSEDVVLSVGVK